MVGRRFCRLPNLLQEVREYVRRRALLDTVYARDGQVLRRPPKSKTDVPMFLDGKYGAGGKSKRRLDLKTSSMCHYWIEGCLTNSNTRFRKFFRVSRARFDQMYEAAGDRGEFRLNPAEPLFSRAYPEPPTGN